MRLLLDTHILLWALAAPERLSADARHMIQEPDNEILFSAASIWEVAIKAQIRRADFEADPQEIAAAARGSGFVELPVHADAAARVNDLPMHHRDPFDRLLIAQALTEPARLVTVDRQLAAYSDIVMCL